MALGTRKQRIQPETLSIAKQELPASAAHPFSARRKLLLEAENCDQFAEAACQQFPARKMGRPSLTPCRSFPALLAGCFKGIDFERGIAWRTTASLGVRHLLGIGRDERHPGHSTLSRTRWLIAVETPQQVVGFVRRVVVSPGPLQGAKIVAGPEHRPGRHHRRCQRGHGEQRSPGHRRQRPVPAGAARGPGLPPPAGSGRSHRGAILTNVAFTADDPFRSAPAAMPAATPHYVTASFFDPNFRNAISCQSNVERPKELARRAVLALAPVGSANTRLPVGGTFNTALPPARAADGKERSGLTPRPPITTAPRRAASTTLSNANPGSGLPTA